MAFPKPASRAAEKREKQNAKKLLERAIWRIVDLRDGRRCRACGREADPSATGMLKRGHRHHIVFRSAGGDTTSNNLVTLCAVCHSEVHAHRLTIKGDANHPLHIHREDR